MIEPLLILSLLFGFFIVLFLVPAWIKRAKKAGLVGEDMHKLNKEEIAESGGVPVLIGFILGVLSYVAIKTFYFKTTENLIGTFTILSSLLIIGFIGILDDILGWKIGLTKKTRLIFPILAAVPLMVINAGESSLMGIEFGILYPLLLIPLGIIGASIAFNSIAGYNGLEASQGILILSALSIVAKVNDNAWLSMIALSMVVSLLAFYIFNKTPAKVFPGNIMTYPTGALIAIMAIMGNMERIAIFFFIPYIIEAGLKLRGRLKKESYAKLKSDGSLEQPYEKIYGLEHLSLKILKRFKKDGKVYENEVVRLINIFQIIIIFLGFLIFEVPIENLFN